MKTESETGVKSDTPFCSRLPIEKTNSAIELPCERFIEIKATYVASSLPPKRGLLAVFFPTIFRQIQANTCRNSELQGDFG